MRKWGGHWAGCEGWKFVRNLFYGAESFLWISVIVVGSSIVWNDAARIIQAKMNVLFNYHLSNSALGLEQLSIMWAELISSWYRRLSCWKRTQRYCKQTTEILHMKSHHSLARCRITLLMLHSAHLQHLKKYIRWLPRRNEFQAELCFFDQRLGTSSNY